MTDSLPVCATHALRASRYHPFRVVALGGKFRESSHAGVAKTEASRGNLRSGRLV